jgi:hypothetical protein
MTPGSVIAPMTWLEPTQVRHRLQSMANTQCNRAIQLIGVLRTPGWGSPSLSVARWLTTLGRTTMPARSRALAALAHPCASRHRHILVHWARIGRATSLDALLDAEPAPRVGR